ncbi:MAG: hypothetical protein ACN4G0_07805 [Polyangiales bacterium]
MKLRNMFIIVASFASLGLASCDSSAGGSGSDIIRLVNPLAAEISASVGYPSGQVHSVMLNRRSPADETILNTTYVAGERYTFNASSPGVTPATPTVCVVQPLAEMTGAADVQFYVETGTTFITIECDYDALRDVNDP